jgi:hypothetical protein
MILAIGQGVRFQVRDRRSYVAQKHKSRAEWQRNWGPVETLGFPTAVQCLITGVDKMMLAADVHCEWKELQAMLPSNGASSGCSS